MIWMLYPAIAALALVFRLATDEAPIFDESFDEPRTVCNLITITDLAGKAVPEFSAFPARPSPALRPASVNLKSHPRASLYRTRIREGAAEGPNFAGHFTIVGWGCGTSCLQWAVVNARTGAVFFPPKSIAIVSTVHVNTAPGEAEPFFNGLRFQANSELLIILGAPNEDESREGISFYRWTGTTFRFVQALRVRRAWCTPEPPGRQ